MVLCLAAICACAPCASLGSNNEVLRGRSMLVEKCLPLPVECIVRGFNYGSMWSLYKAGQREICGINFRDGLVEASLLEEPVFTATTKAEQGHDQNITFEQMVEILVNFVKDKARGRSLAEQVRRYSIALYKFAREYADVRGIIVADTKFEFGLDGDGRLVLIDEVLTPDSSRFWPKDQYKPGRSQPSFDKQFLRDYLETLCKAGKWNKAPPAPQLPADVIEKTAAKYREAFRLLTA